jgi:hypothetical protein
MILYCLKLIIHKFGDMSLPKQETSKEQLESLHFKWNDVGLIFTTTTSLFCNVAKCVIDALASSILSETEVSEISVISEGTGSLICAMDGLQMVGILVAVRVELYSFTIRW